MKKICMYMLIAVMFFSLTHYACSNTESQKKLAANEPIKIPLVIGRVLLPGQSLVDSAIMYESDPSVEAVINGSQQAGLLAGYDFSPVRILKVGEKPRDVMKKMFSKSDKVLLITTKTSGMSGLLFVFADITIYRKSGVEPVEHVNMIAANTVSGSTHASAITDIFVPYFDGEFLSKLQKNDPNKATKEVLKKLKQSKDNKELNAKISSLGGGDERTPEVKVVVSKKDMIATVFLEPKEGSQKRYWYLEHGSNLHTNGEPGDYNIYVELRSKKDSGFKETYKGELTVEYKNLYSYSIP